MERKFTLASPATALASRVLPVPGGPTSSTPLGMRAPRSRKRLGFCRNSTISCSSSFSSWAPATSAKVIRRSWSLAVRTFARPNRVTLVPLLELPLLVLLCRRYMK